ncbi:MAG: hypothetical protein WA188_01500 [Terriglobales bacterium]
MAYAETGKFLGLLVWNEAMQDAEDWHFTAYPKQDSDFFVNWYFSVNASIRARARQHQADTARAHGDEERALGLEEAAVALRNKWGADGGGGRST